MTHPEETTLTVERDLRAVDDALRGGAADHGDPFARELQRRVDAGFPPEPGSARARAGAARLSMLAAFGRLPSPRRMLPAAGALVTVVALVAVLGSVDLNRAEDQSADDGGGGAAVAPRDRAGG